MSLDFLSHCTNDSRAAPMNVAGGCTVQAEIGEMWLAEVYKAHADHPTSAAVMGQNVFTLWMAAGQCLGSYE